MSCLASTGFLGLSILSLVANQLLSGMIPQGGGLRVGLGVGEASHTPWTEMDMSSDMSRFGARTMTAK